MAGGLTTSTMALGAALLSAHALAQTPAHTAQTPKAVPEAPAMGGEPQTKPGPAVISLRANEVALSRVADASLIRNTSEKLGQLSPNLYGNSLNTTAEVPQKIGTLTSAVIDPAHNDISVVGVKTSGSDKITALPWSDIQPIHQPNDQFRTTMTTQAIAAAPAFPETGSGSNTIDVKQAFLGRSVTTADGKTAGTITDVVAEIKSGKLDYVVVKPSGLQLGTMNAAHAVPWAKLKPISSDKSQPVTLALNDQQLASLPVFGGSKAQETAGTRAAGERVGATEPPAP